MKLVVGLGNPGPEYAETRHNIGFVVADRFAAALGVAVGRKKLGGHFGEGRLGELAVGIVKPQTFMNRSGEVVTAFCRYFHLATDDLLVVHDELDLPLGQLRFAKARGSAGHRGVESIIGALGTSGFDRLRVGIGRPEQGGDPTAYVLERFASAERAGAEAVAVRAGEAVGTYLERGVEWAMGQYHRRGSEEAV